MPFDSRQDNIILKPFPKQIQFIKNVFSAKYSFLCYGGAVGGGKTYTVLMTLLLLCNAYPKSKWVVIRESLPTLKRTTLPSFHKILPYNWIAKYNDADKIYTFKNGSQISFMSEDYAGDKDFHRFKGLEVNGFVLEQIEELQEELLSVCYLRSRRNIIEPMPHRIIMATVNPSLTWVKKRIYEPFINESLSEGWYYLPATIEDNAILSEDKDYLSNFERLDPLMYRRMVKGDWDAFAVNKPFLYCFNEQKHISEKAIRKEKAVVYLSFDFNVDPSVCVIWQEGQGWIHYIDELYLENSNIYEICAWIKSKYMNSFFMITGDASGASRHHTQKGNINSYTIIKQELRLTNEQMKVPSVNPPIEESRVLCNAVLANHTEILFNPICKKLIEDMKYTEVGEDGKIDCKGNKHRGHLLDAFRYSLNTFHNKFLINRI